MAILITDDCIVCNACEPECPNNAIYAEGSSWKWSDGTTLKEIQLEDGSFVNGYTPQDPLSEKIYFIVPGKCTECTGFHEEPACAAVCPVDCCVPDPDVRESKEELFAKKEWLHAS